MVAGPKNTLANTICKGPPSECIHPHYCAAHCTFHRQFFSLTIGFFQKKIECFDALFSDANLKSIACVDELHGMHVWNAKQTTTGHFKIRVEDHFRGSILKSLKPVAINFSFLWGNCPPPPPIQSNPIQVHAAPNHFKGDLKSQPSQGVGPAWSGSPAGVSTRA